MLIKKKLKINQFASLSIISKLKRLPFFVYPACKKQNNYETANTLFPFLFPKIERKLFESLSCSKNSKRKIQIKKNIFPFLYSINLLHFQKKENISNFYKVRTGVLLEKINSKKQSNNFFASFAQINTKKKKSRLTIILKSYSNQIKDIETSVATISKVTNFLKDSFIKRQSKSLLVNTLDLSFFNLKTSFFNQNNKNNKNEMKHFKNRKDYYSIIPNTLSVLKNFEIWRMSFQKIEEVNVVQMTFNSNLLIGQPLVELFGKIKLFNEKKKNLPAFLFFKKTLQKRHYSNRYFFKSLASLDKKGPISKQLQKTFNSRELFTVIRSPFVFKKTREQFIKQQLSYIVSIDLDSPIQKQLLIQYLSLLRLPVEFEIRC